MTFDEIEHTDSPGDPQVPFLVRARSHDNEASLRLAWTGEVAADLLGAWLVSACWYANWAEDVSSVAISAVGSFPCPQLDPCAPVRTLRAHCQALLNDMRVDPRTGWLVQAWSDTEQCQGLFGSARLHLRVSATFIELGFDPQVLDRDLAHEVLDTLRALAVALPDDESLTSLALVERARAVQSNSELFGKLQGIADQDVLEAFETHARQAPQKAAICDAGVTISYGRLSRLVGELAARLAGGGVTAGSRVALCMPRSSGFIIAALAVLSLDAIYVPIDLELPAERRNVMIEDARVGWIIDRESSVTCIRPVAETEHPAGCGYVLFTSGTSGRPKGVMVSRASLSYYASVARHTYNLTRDARVLQFATVSFDASVEEIYPCLMAGGTLVIRDPSVDLRPARFLAFVEAQQITFLDLPTGYWRELSLACATQNLRFAPCVKLVVIGGEALYKSDIHAWFRVAAPRPELINSYGPTETTVVTTFQRVRLPGATDAARNDISIGRPIAGSRIILLDRFDKPAPLGGLGEICISSPGVAVGYLNSPEMTDEKFFVQVESDRSQRRYYKSGDLGRIGLDGALEYHGRMDNVVKRQGFRISLGEIESIVRALSEVSDCCVFMTQDGSSGKLLCAVQPMPGMDVTAGDLHHQLSLDLPSYMVPNSFIILGEIPRNLAGKIDYRKVLELAANTHAPQHRDDLGPPVEAELSAGLRSVLGGRELNWGVSLGQNGADSLEIVRLAVFLERHTGQQWPIAALYGYPSLRQIVADAMASKPVVCQERPFSEWRDTELDRLKGMVRRGVTLPERVEDGILVTGATGLLGRHVVSDLVKRTRRPILCLVRRPAGESRASLRRRYLDSMGLSHDEQRRVHLLMGDLELPDLGLEAEQMDTLQRRISDIVHCAADTNMLSPYARLVSTNVHGSLSLINLALASHAAFHFISSLALFDTRPALTSVSPMTAITDIGSVASGYLQSKWMVERLVEQLRHEGLSATVYRCGRLWGGRERLGEASNDYVFQFLGVCQRLRAFPDMPMQLEVCPADSIASQIVSSVIATPRSSAETAGRYHLCSSRSYTVNEIYAAMRQQIPDLALVSATAWLAALTAHVQASPQDLAAMRVFAVLKSLSLADCIDQMMFDDTTASRQWWAQGIPPGLNPEQMVRAVVGGCEPAPADTRIAVHG